MHCGGKGRGRRRGCCIRVCIWGRWRWRLPTAGSAVASAGAHALRRISSPWRHTHRTALWVHPGEEGRTDGARSAAQCCSASAAGGARLTHTYTQTRTNARTQTQRHHFRRKLGQWRDLQPRRSDAGRHGRVFAEGPGQTGGESRALSRADGSFLRVFVSENRDGEADDAEPQAAFLLLGGRGAGGSDHHGK